MSSLAIVPISTATAEEPILGPSAAEHEPQIVRPKSSSLFDLEEGLLALMDTEAMVSPEDQEQFWKQFQNAVEVTIDKRQHVAEFLLHLDAQIELAKQERHRLSARQAHLEDTRERLGSYVLRVIERLPRDNKNKLRRLEGHTVTLSAHGLPASIEILDEEALPPHCRKVEIRMPASLWDTLLDSIDFDLRDQVLSQIGRPRYEPSKTAIQEAIELTVGAEAIAAAKKEGALSVQTEEVPGARLNLNRNRLVIK